ncbi:Dockerin type I repeat-containing protein [Neorhodopirellula lusitana]|uniref:Dockerin type I repeat-containing protein n=1 Tax=Neorhodopirellula lusitana TaxID=445327 RepID=A0ABY1PY23_9BACT|nr:dockerin type I domain-containing protein [Neorhodopirellula lusitana]SMP52665.1 Dockerin type I repeat-containing protein [Neorhodopirellula lusitana]
MLAGDFQNPGNHFDVDDSGLVTAQDALFVINTLNRARSSFVEVETLSLPFDRYVDVNGDDQVTALDALRVINALNRYSGSSQLVFSIAPASDPNANGVVLDPTVVLQGQTSADAQVNATITALDVELNPVAGQSVTFTSMADRAGRFAIEPALFFGLNQVTVTATSPLGATTSATRQIVHGDLVADWNAATLNVVRDWTATSNDPYPDRIVPSIPPIVARNLAMIHVALFDAMNGVSGEFASYTDSALATPETSATAAATTAAHEVAMSLYPDPEDQAVWNATLSESLHSVPEGPAKERGIAYGQQIAAAVLHARANDGADGIVDYLYGDAPGDWNRTAPDFLPPLVPHWESVIPFAVEDITAYRADPPPSLTSAQYASAVDEVMRVGQLGSQERTAEQTEIAIFWVDGGGTATPPGHWNRIASNISLTRGESTLERARTMALLNLALADAGIAAWDTKYAYDLWRPIDAIRRADEDGNATTVADPTWLPLVRTPPFPTYTSGHSTFSGAGAAILTSLYGDDFAFASTSDGQSGLTQRPSALVTIRHFTSFHAAADEAGLSRIYGGIHFNFDHTSGIAAGNAIGSSVADNWLQRESGSGSGSNSSS